MARTILAALPSVAISNGQTVTSPSVAVPLGFSHLMVRIDGTAWPVGTAISAAIDLADDGVTWRRVGAITANKAGLNANFCSVGAALPAANSNSLLKIRGTITVTAGAGITLAGSLSAE